MSELKPSFFARIALAWRVLINARLATEVKRLRQGELAIEAKPAVAPLKEVTPEAALQLLGLLQQEGRFIDFVQEDVTAYSDAEIGGAARVVHEGCCKALREHFTIDPVRQEPEGARLTLEEGFNASAVRLTGNVVGKPPFTGTLMHRGWQVSEVRLPKITEGHDVQVLAPAEVEL